MTPCQRCGAPLPETARFCPSCGLALEPVAAAADERRIVTILFADLVEFTSFSESRDPEEVKHIIDRAFEGLAEIVTVYGGRVDKILGDEIMAVFGAPQAHEDDAERAVRCALEMQRSLEQYSEGLHAERGLKLAMRIGINTGEVMTGSIGGSGDAVTVVGDAVNVASRMVKAAEPGSIVVGPSTKAATERSIDYRDIAPLTVKGKAEAIQAAQAVGEHARIPGYSRVGGPLVGRDAELSMLRSLASISRRDRKPAVVTILGDAGMGKTRLVGEFTSSLTGARVLWGRSLPYGTATPSFAVEEMIRVAFDVAGSDDVATARKKIADGVNALGLASETDRVLSLAGVREAPVAAGVRRAPGGGAGPAAGAAPRGGEMSAAVAMFEAIASQEGLLVLVFQELHWAEQMLLDMVGELIGRARDVPLMIVALGRPELANRVDEWPTRPGSSILQLLPLSRDAAADLLDALAGDQALHPAVRENVLERAGGNPFFIEEFVRLVLDRGDPGAAGVPVSVQALVAARLDTLDATVRRVAQNAAVAGEYFWPDALVAMDPAVDGDQVRGALAELHAREMVRPAEQPSLPGQDEYRFDQTIVREVAYNGLPKQIRAERHAAIAAWLEAITRDSGMEAEFVDLVAHHYERAALSARDVGADAGAYRKKAREFLERAGDEAMGKDAAAAAASFYERALEFVSSDEDELHLRVHLGEAFVGSWNPLKAERHLRQALEDARRLGERRLEGKTLRLLGDLMRIRGDSDQTRAFLEEALHIAKETGDAIEEAEGLRSHGLLDLLSGRVPAAPLWFRQSLARYRELGDRRGEGWSLQNLGWADLLLGRLDEALEMLDEGARVFGELNDIEGVGWCLGLRSWTLLFKGEIDEADDLAATLIAMASSAEANPIGMGGMGIEIERVLRSIVACQRGLFSDAIRSATASFTRFEEAESNWGLAMARFPVGWSQVLRCEYAAARSTLIEGMRYAEEAGDPLVQGLIGWVSAYAEMEAGDLDVAERMLSVAFERTAAAGVGWHADVGRRWLYAELAMHRGDLKDARARLEEEGGSNAGLLPPARATNLLAEVMRRMGDAHAAAETARRAIAEAPHDSIDWMRARLALSGAMLDGGDSDGALTEVAAAIAALEQTEWDSELLRARVQKAKILDDMGRHDEAAEEHERARAILDRFSETADTSSLAALLAT